MIKNYFTILLLVIVGCTSDPFTRVRTSILEDHRNLSIGIMIRSTSTLLYDNDLYFKLSKRAYPENFYLNSFKQILTTELLQNTVFSRVEFINDSLQFTKKWLRTKNNAQLSIALPAASNKHFKEEQNIDYLLILDKYSVAVNDNRLVVAKEIQRQSDQQPITENGSALFTNSAGVAVIDCRTDSIIQFGSLIYTESFTNPEIGDYYECAREFCTRIFEKSIFTYIR